MPASDTSSSSSRPPPASDGPPYSGLLEVDESVVDDLVTLLAERQRGMVLNLVADLYPADVALLLRRLPNAEARRLFRWLPPEMGADVLAEMEDTVRAALLEEMPPDAIVGLVDALDTDDAADVLADLPDEGVLQVLPDLEAAEDLTELLEYGEETAGGIMAREYVVIAPDQTLQEATEAVRQSATDIDEVYTAYVVDEAGTLLGTLSLKQLLLSAGAVKVRDVMDADVISVPPQVDQEEVGRVVQRYDLVSLPVVNEAGRMMGRITIDDVVDVIRDEAEEDMQLMSGLTGEEETVDSAVQVSRGRLPWLIVGLVGSGLSGTVIGVFEATLQQAVVLATFIPVVTAMGGNAAVQSAAIAVQGLGAGELWLSDAFERIGKEMLVALLNGLVVAALLCGTVAALGMGNVMTLVSTLALTMLSVSLVATTNGALIPFLLTWLGIDPASAMGPFVTTLNDILGLALYFLIATALYL
ncbi:magnesium transporter [Salinibacter altiplanensis]|uniref:magnesium transporter n=1 Tax=Salinibacter altiplanensis TaxID=1803181 RepID=UPI000C9F8E0A|nr:magnesium transporter [Salinibacter altiplanensis]